MLECKSPSRVHFVPKSFEDLKRMISGERLIYGSLYFPEKVHIWYFKKYLLKK